MLCEAGLSPPVKYFYRPFQGRASFVDHLCYFCLVFGMLSCALWSWFVMSYCEVGTFPLVFWVRRGVDCIDS